MAYTVIIGDKFSGPMARKSAPTRGAAMAHAKSELRDYMSTGDKHERQGHLVGEIVDAYGVPADIVAVIRKEA